MTPERRRALGRGLVSLAKAAILAFGVPFTLLRLWMLLAASPSNNAWQANGLWIRAIIVIVALLWAKALISLIVEIKRAMHGAHPTSEAWSVRWAVAIAGLALLLSVWHVSALPASPIVVPSHAVTSLSQAQSRRSMTAQLIPEIATPKIAECLSEVALRSLGERELWSALAAHNMDRVILPGERFVDPSLLRANWCLPVQSGRNTANVAKVSTSTHHQRNALEELEWLGLGILGTAAFVRRLQVLRRAARSSRALGERLEHRDVELEALEARIAPFGEAVLLDWIEVANRHLRRIAGLLRISPPVGLVRAGPTGVTFFFTSSMPPAPLPFVASEDGESWTLPLELSLSSMQAQVAHVGRMIPSLVPVGDDGEHCYLVAVSPGQSLTIDAAPHVADEIVRGITMALRTLPWAEELHVELMNLAPPPATEHCYQMAHSSAAALAELAANPPPRRHPTASPTWRREPLIITSAFADDQIVIPVVAAVAGVIQLGANGTARLHVNGSRARLEPFGVDVRVPRPTTTAADLIERLFARASTIPTLTPLPDVHPLGIASEGASSRDEARVVIQLLDTPPGVTGLSGELVEQDRTRVIEVLAYLALHDNSCTLTEISDALFPRAGVAAPRRIDDALAATRRALNEQIAISISPERITVGREMTSDWSDLTRALASARAGSASDTLVVLAEVVERSLRPLAAAFRWMHTEGHLVRLSFELCDAMHQLFSLALAQSDFELADRALLVGLANEPTSELLIRDLMILQNERGGSGAVTACYEQLEAALVEVGGREPSWTTRALFEELAGRSG